MRIRATVGIDLLGMTELQTTREVYLLPDGMTGTDRLSYPLCLIDTAHAWLFTSLCRFSDSDGTVLLMQYKLQCSGDLGREVMQNFF